MSQPTYLKFRLDSSQNDKLIAICLTESEIKTLQEKDKPSAYLLILHLIASAGSLVYYFYAQFPPMNTTTKNINGMVVEKIVKPSYQVSQKYRLLSTIVVIAMTLSCLVHAYLYNSRPPFDRRKTIRVIQELCNKTLQDGEYIPFKAGKKFYIFQNKNTYCSSSDKEAFNSDITDRVKKQIFPTPFETILNS